MSVNVADKKTRASARMEENLLKLSFLNDAIKFWDTNTIPLESETQYGFSICMEETISDIKECVSILENN